MASFVSVPLLMALLCTTTILVCDSSQQNRDSHSLSPGAYGHHFFYEQAEYPRDCEEVKEQCSASNFSGVYLIKPDGIQQPFEVFCENGIGSRAWTVIQRRENVLINFNRSWSEYKNGFGFPTTDFWLGNGKLSYLTNQAVYQLRIDLELSTGESFYTTYRGFRISDEFGEYSLAAVGQFKTDEDDVISGCPVNMKYGTCVCQVTCEFPNGDDACHSRCLDREDCVCPEGFFISGNECVQRSECGCFLKEADLIIAEGATLVNDDCTSKCLCTDNQLHCDDTFSCGANAECSVTNEVRQCYCREGYEGDGQSCEALYTDCKDVYDAGNTRDGIYTIRPSGWPGTPFSVYCKMDNGGGWTIIQRRIDSSTNFYQNWNSYRNGFGDIDTNFWIGNDKLHYLTNQRVYKLRFEVTTSGGSYKYAEFSEFQIESERTNYRMNKLGSFTGTSGAFSGGLRYSRGKQFSTYDRDNDACQYAHCAQEHRSGWWHFGTTPGCISCDNSYHSCDRFPSGGCYTVCTYDNLNGVYGGGYGENIFTNAFDHCNLRYVEMKIRPTS